MRKDKEVARTGVLILLCALGSCTHDAGESESVSAVPEVTLGEPVIVAVSPPGEKRWGFYQFPDMWRGRGGQIYLAMNVGEDAEVGVHQPTKFFVSRNEGRSWQPIPENQVDFSPDILTLPTGEQVAFGTEKYVYHYSSYGHRNREEISLDELGLKPVMTFRDAWNVQVFSYYRYVDLPQRVRRFPLTARANPDAPWQNEYGTVEPSDLLLSVLVQARDATGEWHDLPRVVRVSPYYQAGSIFRPPDWPKVVLALADGSLLWAHSTQDPRFERTFFRVQCLASSDGGRSWRVRGTIADQAGLATFGYGCGEQSIERMPNGDLLCVMRTQLGRDPKASNHLAAARSSDGGHTWTPPRELAAFSVTPHLRRLENGAVAVVYGRPGVHVRASADSGRTWSSAHSLVGPAETELLAMSPEDRWDLSGKISCSNTDVVITGADRFLVAYSDFRYLDVQGRQRKAIKVREVIVN
ncbi:MAG: sialidase family protein [Acidobacteriota bacterium]|nr:sialidase family protein [Acidobacteriota bacterium]MDE2926622.1 sialidase family protein [Acidobacteriota bacterium]